MLVRTCLARFNIINKSVFNFDIIRVIDSRNNVNIARQKYETISLIFNFESICYTYIINFSKCFIFCENKIIYIFKEMINI